MPPTTAPQATPLLPSIPRPSRLTFNDLIITFKVDESLQSYLEIHNWMRSLGEPESFQQYKDILTRNGVGHPGVGDTVSDGTLTVYSNKYQPKYRIIFHDMWPTSLSDLSFNTTDTDVTYLNADVSFKYMVYTVEPLPVAV